MPNAIVLREFGPAENLVFEEVVRPEPGPGQLRLRVSAIGANYHDVYVRTGLYRTLDLPGIPGIELVGVVDALGEGVTGPAPGTRVACVTGRYGCYAEEAVVPAELVLPMPDAVSDEAAAAGMLKGLTAAMLLTEAYRVGAATTLLIHAGAGGVGQIVTRWAKALGASVISTVGSEAKARVAQACGADHVILYREEDFVARVKEITGGRGVDVAYDSVGKDTFAGSLDCLAPLGHLVNFGQASGPVPPFEVSRLAAGSHTLLRPIIFHYLADPARRGPLFEMLLGAMEAGLVTPDVALSLPLSEAAEAHRALESRALAGAVILRP
ncbi:MAG: quinone oxidoreductase [Alphaproteobacteria bacterium]